MINYDSRRFLGLSVLCRFYGSSFPRAMPYCVISLVISIIFSAYREDWLMDSQIFYHPYAHQVFAITAGFLLVFRSQLAYQRFWEARTHLTTMQAKWSDAAMQAVIFDDMDGEVTIESEIYRLRIIHLFSLLHALAIQCLRKEPHNAAGLVESTHELAPPVVENRKGRSSMSNATFAKKVFLAESNSANAELHQLQVIMGITEDEHKYLYEVAARTHDDYIGLHRKSDSCVPNQDEDSIKDHDSTDSMDGREPVDETFRVVCWITREIGRRQREGGVKVPPPCLSRFYQVLSDGHAGFMQAKKVSYTPFPLPYLQLVFFFLLVLMVSSPLVIVAYVDNMALAACLSFCASLGYFALNEVGRELDDPFRHDPNDLPLSELHYDFNVRLVSLLHMGFRQNTVNHISPDYLEEGPVRDRFEKSFKYSVTGRTRLQKTPSMMEDLDSNQQSFMDTMQGTLKTKMHMRHSMSATASEMSELPPDSPELQTLCEDLPSPRRGFTPPKLARSSSLPLSTSASIRQRILPGIREEDAGLNEALEDMDAASAISPESKAERPRSLNIVMGLNIEPRATPKPASNNSLGQKEPDDPQYASPRRGVGVQGDGSCPRSASSDANGTFA